ncbi:hypothetical protein EDB85DRAFT_2282530 [Lactarius pseudohatsudake]|nr:hypothetical protein EDB85DRAFT_2282530 [Lactarius pseudohatsudake]
MCENGCSLSVLGHNGIATPHLHLSHKYDTEDSASASARALGDRGHVGHKQRVERQARVARVEGTTPNADASVKRLSYVPAVRGHNTRRIKCKYRPWPSVSSSCNFCQLDECLDFCGRRVVRSQKSVSAEKVAHSSVRGTRKLQGRGDDASVGVTVTRGNLKKRRVVAHALVLAFQQHTLPHTALRQQCYDRPNKNHKPTLSDQATRIQDTLRRDETAKGSEVRSWPAGDARYLIPDNQLFFAAPPATQVHAEARVQALGSTAVHKYFVMPLNMAPCSTLTLTAVS